MRSRLVLAFAIACGCWTGSEPVAPPSPAAPTTCDRDLAIEKSATRALACARDRFTAHDYKAAERVAAEISRLYPYTRAAIESDELHADILLELGRYREAYDAYSHWLRLHPFHEHHDSVVQKQHRAVSAFGPQ
jgi:tetratricopeptide (TPR) repeat protein